MIDVRTKQAIEEYYSGTVRSFVFEDILNDFVQFAKEIKAQRVYHACLRAGKISIACKIARKYRLNEDA